MGSLILELVSYRTIRFKIDTGFNTEERIHPPPIEAIAMFKYTGHYALGNPQFVSFLQVLSDTGEMVGYWDNILLLKGLCSLLNSCLRISSEQI
ncbi:MAG: hypothetical protein ACI8ZB_004896 [Desulforhopalus sp.]|jgi:hypothetical protein